MNRPDYWLMQWRWLLAIFSLLTIATLAIEQPWQQQNPPDVERPESEAELSQ